MKRYNEGAKYRSRIMSQGFLSPAHPRLSQIEYHVRPADFELMCATVRQAPSSRYNFHPLMTFYQNVDRVALISKNAENVTQLKSKLACGHL